MGSINYYYISYICKIDGLLFLSTEVTLINQITTSIHDIWDTIEKKVKRPEGII